MQSNILTWTPNNIYLPESMCYAGMLTNITRRLRLVCDSSETNILLYVIYG